MRKPKINVTEYNQKEEIERYLKIIKNTKDQNLVLVAKEKLILLHEKLIYSIVNKYHSIKLERDDLLQEAYLGFLHAIDTYKYNKNAKLSTYAYKIINQYIKKAIISQTSLITISPYIYNKNINNNKSYNNLQVTLNLENQKLNSTFTTNNNPEIIYYYKKRKDSVYQLLKILNPRDQQIIKLRYGFNNYNPLTLEEIGQYYNLTKSSISKTLKLSLRQIKKYLENNPNKMITKI